MRRRASIKAYTFHFRAAINIAAIENNIHVSIHLKAALTIKEAAEHSNIGINKIDQPLRRPNCTFVLFVGTKKLVKRKAFEDFIQNMLII